MDDDFFAGPERIAAFGPSGQPMRMGSPAELAISDYQRVLEAIERADVAAARPYLALQLGAASTMIAVYSQWPSAYRLAAEELAGQRDAARLVQAAYAHWRQAVAGLGEAGSIESDAVEAVASWLAPENFTSEFAKEAIAAFGAGRTPPHVAEALASLERYKARLEGNPTGRTATMRDAYDAFFRHARCTHDALVQYTDSFPTVAAMRLGQSVAEKLVDRSFRLAPFSQALWDFGATLTQKELAAFLMNHLRDHFSGPGREGAVKLIEHADRYELVFDPCGSGGAMRRRRGDAQYRLTEASPATFGRRAAVPPYCTHCAFNAMTSIRRFGWPIYVTEFDPDPTKPCGWTVYKKAADVPTRHYRAVGMQRDPDKFTERT